MGPRIREDEIWVVIPAKAGIHNPIGPRIREDDRKAFSVIPALSLSFPRKRESPPSIA